MNTPDTRPSLDPVEQGEKLTVEDWRRHTNNWSLFSKAIAVVGRGRPYETRKKAAGELFEKRHRFGDRSDREYAEFVVNVWALSDEALDRMIASFDQESMQIISAIRNRD